jgi:hypothetical protein
MKYRTAWLYWLIFFCSMCSSNISYAAKDAAPTGARTITFVNNCSYPVWFGLSSGSAPNNHPSFPGDTSCSSNANCYMGSTCIQTGTLKQCFWSTPIPEDGQYQLSAGGGTNSVSIPLYPNAINVSWSGAVAGRTNCASGVCDTADCGAGTEGCPQGSGFQQPATQAEFALSLSTVDSYDVEVINGVNVPIEMTPILSPSQRSALTKETTNPYSCGNPGGATPMNSMLGACTWKFTPPSNDYNWVKNGGNACSLDSDCRSPSVCGMSFNPGKTPLLSKTCGNLLGYWTADQVCGIQPNYGAPFNCGQSLPAPQNNLALWNLYACAGMGSCYSDGASADCCGCVNWDKSGLTIPTGPYTKQCVNTNPTWNKYVEPSLAWIKTACPTSYVYPYDDESSSFTCSVMENNVNNVNYTITYCPNGGANPPPPPPPPPPPQQTFSYTVNVGAPFSSVIINGNITCPNPATGSRSCLLSNQTSGSTVIITGSNTDICNLTIQSNGSLVINNNSHGCNIYSLPPTLTAPGIINLPSNF